MTRPLLDHNRARVRAMQRFILRGLFDYDEPSQLVVEQAQDWSLSADFLFKLAMPFTFPVPRELVSASPTMESAISNK